MLRHLQIVLLAGLTLLGSMLEAQGPAGDFKPDTVFAGSGLGAWTVVGGGKWAAEKGEVRGKAETGASWLVLDALYQDLNFFTRFQCAAPCDTGVLFRVEATAAGRSGIFVSLKDGDLATYRVTLDSSGHITTREALPPVGPFLRSAPAPGSPDAARPISNVGAGRGGSPMTLPTRLPDLEPPPSGLRSGEWNQLSVAIDSDVIRPTLNRGLDFSAGATGDRITHSGAASLMSSPAEGGRFPAANSGAAEPALRLLSAEDPLVESGASDATGDPGSEQATALELKP